MTKLEDELKDARYVNMHYKNMYVQNIHEKLLGFSRWLTVPFSRKDLAALGWVVMLEK